MKASLAKVLTTTALSLALSLALSGCLTLASDITPPPQSLSANPQPTAAVPTQTPEIVSGGSMDVPVPEPGAGEVAVDVIDQTGGGLLEGDLTVSLEGYDQFELVFQTSLDVPDSGRVSFREVPLVTDRVFFASVAYGGAIYRSEIVQASEETSFLELQVQIFETTTETAGLVIERLHILLDFPSPDLIQVSEIFILSNLDSATIVAPSPGQASVEFPLPEGAQSLLFEEGALGQRYTLTETGFGDTVSIPPGQGVYQVVVSYQLPYSRARLDFSQVLNYPLNAHVVLVPAGAVKVRSSSLEDLGVQSFSEGDIQVFSGGPLAGGAALEFSLAGSPYAGAGGFSLAGEYSTWAMIGLGILGFGLLASGVWLYTRSRQSGSGSGQAAPALESRDQIMDKIIALDDLYQTGEIDGDTYHKKRDQLKAELKDAFGNE